MDTGRHRSVRLEAFPKADRSSDAPTSLLLTAKEAAKLLKVSTSWLAKARMRGDGPPYIQLGRAIRYTDAAIAQWLRSRQRVSTSEQ